MYDRERQAPFPDVSVLYYYERKKTYRSIENMRINSTMVETDIAIKGLKFPECLRSGLDYRIQKAYEIKADLS